MHIDKLNVTSTYEHGKTVKILTRSRYQGKTTKNINTKFIQVTGLMSNMFGQFGAGVFSQDEVRGPVITIFQSRFSEL